MNLQELGLVHPEWDTEIGDDELALFEKAASDEGTIHGMSATLYRHLPRQVKAQLAAQQKHMDSLVATLLVRLGRANSAPIVDGGCFYTDSAGRDIHLACKAIVRADSKLKLNMSRSQRHSVIEALYAFVCRHADPSLVFHPKALKTSMSLLDPLLHTEMRAILLEKTYDSFEIEGFVPSVDGPFCRSLRLDWKPLHAFVRTILNFDENRRNPVHYRSSPPANGENLLETVHRCSYFFSDDSLAELFKTVFPLLFTTVPTIPVASNPDLIEYQTKLSKIEDAVLIAHMLPIMANPQIVDYNALIDQIMEIWPLVADSNQWDRAMATMISNISKHNLIHWKPNHVRMIFATNLRQLRLATAGTPFPTPQHCAQPTMILGSFSFGSSNQPLGRLAGTLISQILSSDDQYDGKETTECPTNIFLHWLAQIEGYLHPNNTGTHVTILKNILSGLTADLSDRLKAAIIADDCRRFMKDAGIQPHQQCVSQGYYDYFGLPIVYNGSLENYLIRELIWDALCPAFDRLRIHLPGSSVGRDLAFIIAHVRPSYLNTSIFPRISYALENPMLGGRLHVPASIEVLTLTLPLLLTLPSGPTRVMEFLDPLLSHIDPNDASKTAYTFNFVLALVLALTERKRAKLHSATRSKSNLDSIRLPEELSKTILAKTFNELKSRYEHTIESTWYPYNVLRRGEKQTAPENDNHQHNQQDLESELVALDSMTSEWVIAFFQRTLEFVNGVPSGTSASPSLIHCVKAVVEYASNSTFDLLLRKLTEAIEAVPRSKPDLNSIVDAFARVRPTQTLHACLDQWLGSVKKRAQQVAKASASSSSSSSSADKPKKLTVESEVESTTWKLDLLRLVCKRSGAPIGPHEKTLLAIIEPLFLKECDKRIRRAALSVLPAALGPMKPAFNSLFDPLDSGKLRTFTDVLLDQASFVEPNKESLELASRWVSHFVTPILQSVQDATVLCSTTVDVITGITATSTAATASSSSESSAETSVTFPKDLADQLRLLFEFISALGPIISPSNASSVPSNAPDSFQSLSDSTSAMLSGLALDSSVEFGVPPSTTTTTTTSDSFSSSSKSSSPSAISSELLSSGGKESPSQSKQAATKLGVWTNSTKPANLPENLRTLRAQVVSVVQAFVSAAIMTGKCLEVKVVRRSFKVLMQALAHNGAKDTKWADKISRLAASSSEGTEATGGNEKSKRKQQKESKTLELSGAVQSLPVSYPARYALSPLHPYYRHWRVNKSGTMLKDRWWTTRHKLAFGVTELELFKSFISLSTSHLEVIRSTKLLRLLMENLPRFTGAASLLNQVLLAAIAKPMQSDQPIHSFTGFIGMLSTPFAIGNVASSWKNLSQFAQVWRGLHIHDNAMAQMSILGVFAFLIDRLCAMPATPHHDIAQFQAYTQLMNGSLADLLATRPEAHWRYHMYPLILLCSLLRKNIHTPKKRSPSIQENHHHINHHNDRHQQHDAGESGHVSPPTQQDSSNDNNPGLDGLILLKTMLPLQLDVLPAARSISRWAVTTLLTWAQQAGDASHAEIVLPFLRQTKSLDSLLTNICTDRQTKKLSPQSMQPIVAHIIRDADPTGYIGDYELCVGSDLLETGAFVLRFGDLWYRLFESLKIHQNALIETPHHINNNNNNNNYHPKEGETSAPVELGDDLVSQMSQYLVSKLRENLGSRSSASSSSSSSAVAQEQATGEEKSSASASKSPAPTSPSPSSAASPSPEHSDEMEYYFYTLVEVLAGFTRAFPEKALREVWPAIIEAPRISSKRMNSLVFCVAYLVNYHIPLELLEEQLIKPIKEATHGASDFGALSAFEVEARLTLVLFTYQEKGLAKLEPLAELVELLFVTKRVASMPKPQIRSASMRLLAFLTALLSRVGPNTAVSHKALDIHNRCIELLLEPIGNEPQELPVNASSSVASVATAATGSAVPVTAEDRVKTTFLAWFSEALAVRASLPLNAQWWTRLTRAVMELSVDSHSTATAKSATRLLSILSQCIVQPVSEIEQVELVKQVENVKQLASGHTRWKARINAILFLRFFAFNHAVLMPLSSRVELLDWSKHLLEDPNVEVRKGATAAMSSLIRSLCVLDEDMHHLASHFLQVVAANNKRARAMPRQDKDDTPTNTAETIAALTTGTAGLVALVSSCPYSVPSWLPKVLICLQHLSSHSNGAIATLASEEVSQFWKSHRDEWFFHKTRFTEEDLRILEDKPIPSYYA